MKKIVKYTPLVPDKQSQDIESRTRDLSNKSLVLMRQQNLLLTKGDAVFKRKILEFNYFLQNKNIQVISKLIKQMLKG
jgi:hypothetical protein